MDDATLVRVDRVIEDVHDELDRQVDKWGAGRTHSAERWFIILAEEVGEVAKEALELMVAAAEVRQMPKAERTQRVHEAMLARAGQLRSELVQVAAVAISAVECMDRSGMEV